MDVLTQAMQNLSIRMNSMGSKPKKELALFRGRNDPRSFQQFIRELNVMANAYNWSNAELMRTLPLFLAPECQSAYENLTDAQKNPEAEGSSWEAMTTLLNTAFSNVGSVPHFRRMIVNRRQRAGESISEFAAALKLLAEKAFLGSQGFTEAMRN
jgi:hypothetical protein